MRDKIVAAKVLTEDNGHSINKLLREAITDGWQPQGGISSCVVDNRSYMEILVIMYEDEL